MAYAELVNRLAEDLKLARAPIGMAFLEEPPPGIQRYAEAVPSACTFWKAAETSLFYATADDHYNCPIGAMTQGFRIPQEVVEKAKSLIETMGKLAYLEAAEAQHVPKVENGHRVIVYGPLRDFERVKPDVALLICAPRQAMVISEASGIVAWGGAAAARSLGRPACAVIPSALKTGSTMVSMGCIGARTFAGIDDQELIVAIPASGLKKLEELLAKIIEANSAMRNYYQEHKSRYAPL